MKYNFSQLMITMCTMTGVLSSAHIFSGENENSWKKAETQEDIDTLLTIEHYKLSEGIYSDIPIDINMIKNEISDDFFVILNDDKLKETYKEKEELNKVLPNIEIVSNLQSYEKAELSLNSLKTTAVSAKEYIKDKSGVPTKEELTILEEIYSLPEGLLYSVMLKESNGDTFAESHKKAKGLFQFTEQTAKEFGLMTEDKDLRTDEWLSADTAARYLAWIFTYMHSNKDRLDINNYKYVLAGYNAGLSKVKNKNTLSIPNYKETQNYVRIIIGHVKGDYYKVQKGDLFHNIANNHNLTSKKLTKLNKGITQKSLIAGNYLLINEEKAQKKHTVKTGDSLYRLARTYETSIEDIIVANALSGNMIKIGQQLSIPF